jgi:apolipoprotein D and lipocalin family protein
VPSLHTAVRLIELLGCAHALLRPLGAALSKRKELFSRKIRNVALMFGLAISGSAVAAELATVPDVDLSRYMGTWHEQANFPMYFQRNCARNTKAIYSAMEGGQVAIRNECETHDGKTIEASGVARRAGGSSSKLEVRFAPAFLSFLPFVWGDYWIIALDADYQWSIVGTPDKKYLWILSRNKSLSPELYQNLVEIAKSKGFDTGRLVRTEQRVLPGVTDSNAPPAPRLSLHTFSPLSKCHVGQQPTRNREYEPRSSFAEGA